LREKEGEGGRKSQYFWMAILESAGSANLKSGKREIEMEERRRERRNTKVKATHGIGTCPYAPASKRSCTTKPGMCFENTARQTVSNRPTPTQSKQEAPY